MKMLISGIFLIAFIIGTEAQNGVTGGDDLLPDTFPANVYASLRDSNDDHVCGGTIVSPTCILTAAHCIVNTDVSYVVVGTIVNDYSSGFLVNINNLIWLNALYNPLTRKHDIGLVKVDPMVFDNQVNSAGLPTSNTFYRSVIAMGWQDPILFGSPLQSVHVPTLPRANCLTLPHSKPIYLTELCTQSLPSINQCIGDDGGPVFARPGRVYAVMSWRDNYCSSGHPCVSTLVYPYKNWINSNCA